MWCCVRCCYLYGCLLCRLRCHAMDYLTNHAEQVYTSSTTLNPPFKFLIYNLIAVSFSLWAPIHVVAFNTIVFMLTMAHLKAVLSDPGTVPLPQSRLDFSDLHSAKKNGIDREEWTVCTRCETYRPPRAHHCRICKRCIR